MSLLLKRIFDFLPNLFAPKAKPSPPIVPSGRRIVPEELQPGDFLVFQGSGFPFRILGGILKLFERKWDFWGWHVAFVATPSTLCESIGQGVVVSALSKYTPEQTRCYRWFNEQPDQARINHFVGAHLGDDYDVLVYFNTICQYIIRHFWNRAIPRLLDNRYSCWELVFQFADDMGKEISSDYDCPMLTDLLKTMGEM